MSTEQRVVISGTIAALIIAVPLVYFLFQPRTITAPLWNMASSTDTARDAYSFIPSSDSSLVRFTKGMEAWYVNEKLHFSFRIPDGFSAPDGALKGSSGQVVILSNNKGDDLLILALPITNGANQILTEQIVRDNAPGQNLSGFRESSLKEGTRGLSFRTDSSEWGGDGIAFWFTHDGYLYELTTYGKDAELLDLVMQTWRFSVPVAPPAK